MPDWKFVINELEQHTGSIFLEESAQMVTGGDINRSYTLQTKDKHSVFIKFNERNKIDMFSKEAEGLNALAESQSVRVPEVIFYSQSESDSYLVLEHLELSQKRDETLFGQQLAAMHRYTQEQFGWHQNNTIGLTPQINTLDNSWCDFWLKNRLKPQLKIAQRNNCGMHLTKLGDRLVDRSPALFANHKPAASLLHGDLWGGNSAGLIDGTPIIFDPAVYFGDREVDLAMMELFGGYDKACYDSYNEAYPVDKHGYGLRKLYYNLYHMLNHFNLFGSGYHARCVDIMEKLLAEI